MDKKEIGLALRYLIIGFICMAIGIFALVSSVASKLLILLLLVAMCGVVFFLLGICGLISIEKR